MPVSDLSNSRAATNALLAAAREAHWRPQAVARFLWQATDRSVRQAARHPRALAELTALHGLLLPLTRTRQDRRWATVSWTLGALHLACWRTVTGSPLPTRSPFTGEGITVHTGAALTAVSAQDGQKTATVRTGAGRESELHAEQLLIATGRRPVTSGLNLEQVGVKTGRQGEVIVNDRLRTSRERIWAAGDVTGGPQFVYVAAAQGTLVADNALDGVERTLDYTALPRVTFTSPAIASVGMTDAQAAEAGITCQCRTLPLAYVPRALANRDTRGLVKLVVAADTGRLLGAHVIADSAGDIITAATYAISAGMTVDRIAHTWAPYLTMAEALKLAAQTFTSDVAKLSCCA